MRDRLLFRRPWQERHAVLQLGESGFSPQLLLFQKEDMEQLHEAIVLLPPLQMHCLPAEGPLFRFTLSAARCAPIELAAASEEMRAHWMLALGDSVCNPPTHPVLSPSPSFGSESSGDSESPLSSPERSPSPPVRRSCNAEWSSLEGRVQLTRSKVADNYTMGKVLEQSEDLIVVEGMHRKRRASHVLKIVSKSSPNLKQLRREGCTLPAGGADLIGTCIEEVYEGPNHVCLVMKWGMHQHDTRHQLAAAVLEALRLLHELLPSSTHGEGAHMRLHGADARRLVHRVLALDRQLQANLFI